MMQASKTIVAVATPPGQGGIGVVRVSGPRAYAIGQTLTQVTLKPRQAQFCQLKDASGGLLDEAIVVYFRAPYSFTGDDVVEFQCHGSPIVLDTVVQQCLLQGASLAEAGEFSLTAFLNGKIDLVQAEAIADLIHASSEEAVRMAQRSLQGEFSNLIAQLKEKLIHLRVLVEAGIDFPDEDVDILSEAQAQSKLEAVLEQVAQILAQAKQGALMREGCRMVIVGQPNAGKSTLMNALAGSDVAIVTPLPGTTRDVMRETILIEGMPFLLVDTAGLRETECLIEQEGMKRAKNAVNEADLLLWLIDCQTQEEALPLDTLLGFTPAAHIKVLKILNKIDVCDEALLRDDTSLAISAKTGDGLEPLRQAMLKAVGFQKTESLFLARRRHLNALEATEKALQAALNQVQTTQSLELIAEDLRVAQLGLSDITGEFSSDQLLGEIFSTFCIGK